MSINEQLAQILQGLEAVHKEFEAAEDQASVRVAERAIQKRKEWHEYDIKGSYAGVFMEAATETANDPETAKELYSLMLEDTAKFGARFAELIREYSDDTALVMAGKEKDRD